jgi:hypothetical protein
MAIIVLMVPAKARPRCLRAGHFTGAKAEAWCLLILADASLSLSHGINIAEGGLTALVIIIFIVLVVIIVFVFSGGRQRSYSRANNGTPRRAAAAE